ncbi:Retrovirus-related Pol polyprotein from transposon [Dictyocoela muelleri]|nr:Retrovirus-related Pol polyprotein from transposon [Dictyocoela muelleri]
MFELLGKLKESKFFSNIDLNQGYYQIPIENKDTEKTGFRILNRTFVFQRMPFGLSNAPSTFQKAMNHLFRSVENCIIYLDDILIYTKDIGTHYETLKKVFQIIKENNISVNFEKSEFVKRQINFLGHTITEKGIIPNISKLDNLSCESVKTKKHLQHLLGVINWYRPFIPNISIKLHPIYELLKTKDRKIQFSNADKKLIQQVIEEIKQKPLLNHPDINQNFVLKCDASKHGIGSVLLQKAKIIGFYSSKYSPQENNYSIVEKEVLSIIKSLNHFKPLIYNTKIFIYTDNKNLTFRGPLTKRIERWKLTLEEYDYELLHIEGKNNEHADSLSRLLLISEKTDPHDKDRIEYPQFEIESIKTALLQKNKCDINKQNEKFNDLKEIIKSLHKKFIHPGIVKMELLARRYFKIPGIKRIIQDVCNECNGCNTSKEFRRIYGATNNHLSVSNINECISIDLKGPIKSHHFKHTRKPKCFYILVISDIFSRYTESFIIYNIEATTVISYLLKSWITKYGAPIKCLTDNGRQFTSVKFAEIM